MLRVGLTPYLNALPFSLPFTCNALHSEARLTYDIPSGLNQKLREGHLDLALTSSWEYDPARYTLLPGYGLAAHHAILSVTLYLKKARHELQTIGVTRDSLTSVTLLRLLCTHAWNLAPTFIPLDPEQEATYDAFLWIGDRALHHPTLPGYTTIDLAEAWYQMTQLPFVFALFLLRKEVAYSEAAWDLSAALHWSDAHRPQLLHAASQRSSLPVSRLNQYYDLCHYRLNEKEYEGLRLFYQLSNHVAKT